MAFEDHVERENWYHLLVEMLSGYNLSQSKIKCMIRGGLGMHVHVWMGHVHVWMGHVDGDVHVWMGHVHVWMGHVHVWMGHVHVWMRHVDGDVHVWMGMCTCGWGMCTCG